MHSPPQIRIQRLHANPELGPGETIHIRGLENAVNQALLPLLSPVPRASVQALHSPPTQALCRGTTTWQVMKLAGLKDRRAHLSLTLIL